MSHCFLTIFLLASLLPALRADAQPARAYFPLEIGNRWIFAVTYDADVALPARDTLTVVSRFEDDGVLYFALRSTLFGADTLRTDRDRRIHRRAFGLPDHLLYDFTAEHKASYALPPILAGGEPGVAYVLRGQSFVLPWQTYDAGIRIIIDPFPAQIDDEASFDFVPGVGMVGYARGWVSGHLVESNVGAPTSTDAAGAPQTPLPIHDTAAAVFPNPADDEAVLELRTAGVTSVRLLDLLGRDRTVLREHVGDDASTPVRFRLRTAGLPAGSYLLLVHTGRLRTTVPLTIVH